MIQTKSIIREKINNNSYLFVNCVFGFFPISFILGSLIVNLNLLLFCCLGIYYLKSKILTTKFDFILKIIFLFFFIVFFSTALSLVKTLYFEGYDSANVTSTLARFTKSILFFRYFLLLLVIYLLSKFDILRFKYFLLAVVFASILLSLDIIYQHIFGLDIIGLKGLDFRSSGFFGDENIAGGYLLRFSFFTIFFTIITFKNNNFAKFISTVVVICILGIGLFFTGNRMPLILFILGLFLVFSLDLKIKKIILVSLVLLSLLLTFIISSNEPYKRHLSNHYSSFIEAIENTFLTPFDINIWKGVGIQSWTRTKRVDETEISLGQKKFFHTVKFKSNYLRLALTAIDTWKPNKIFGNGLKSFRVDCGKLATESAVFGKNLVNLGEEQIPDKKNRLCSTHPHNYYFEILTETGIIGLIIASIISLLFIVFIFKNIKFMKQISIENYILLSAIISLFLETFPLRSTGSLYTTNNATYIILIGSIILSYKDLWRVK